MATPPFGYKHHEGKLVADKVEQETIKAVRSRRKKGHSYGKIAAELNREGLLNRGKYWNPTTLWYILKREEQSA